LKLKFDEVVSSFAFKFKLRRYKLAQQHQQQLRMFWQQQMQEIETASDFKNHQLPLGRGLHSSTFQLNLGTLNGIAGARRGCVSRMKGVIGGVGCAGCFLATDTAQVEVRSGRV